MIYLSDVGDGAAPFEYLRDNRRARPVQGGPLTPMHHHNRVAEQTIQRYVARGYEAHRVTGPRATVLVFDTNIIHRGTLAQSDARDVLVLQVRPVACRAVPHIDPRWTGSFPHCNINRDPADLLPRLEMAAGTTTTRRIV